MSSIPICRMCLAVETRMCSIADTPLQEIYERITNIQLKTGDSRPVTACYICHHTLMKCQNFITMSVKSDDVLKQILHKGLEITKSSISQLIGGRQHTSLGAYILQGCSSELPIEFKTEVKIEMDSEVDEYEKFEEHFAHSGILKEDHTHCMVESENVNIKREVEEEIYQSSGAPISDTDSKEPVRKLVLDTGKFENNQGEVPLLYTVEGNKNSQESSNRNSTKTKTSPEHQNKPHQCSQCTKTYKLKESLKIHSRTHTGEKPYQCVQCNRAFRHISNLRTHLTSHTSSKSFECNHCYKSFKLKNTLKIHLKTHNSDKPHKCTICNKSFKLKANLKLHFGTHTGEKPYRCDHCNEYFSRRNVLVAHIRIHTGEKPFKCPHCLESFTQRSTLTNHIKTHTREKLYQCLQCVKAFERKESLVRHVRTHTGDKPYKCSYCSKAFTESGNLKRHLKRHEKEALTH